MTTTADTTSETVGERPQMPFGVPSVLDIAPIYDALRREAPISRVLTPAGDPAWLVTRYEEVRALFGDTRLGRSHPAPEEASRISHAAVQDGPTGDFETEAEDHTRMRKLLLPSFSAKRMRRLGDHVQELVDGCVDRLVAAHDASPDGVADLHEHLSFPLPVAVICELLGVPWDDREYFRDLSDRIGTMTGDGDAQVAWAEFARYMHGLAEAKRAEPGEDVISDLVAAQAEDPGFTEAEMIRLSVGLLFAGHETTVGRIDAGVLFLLTRPERRDALVADAAAVDSTVEEILRLAAPGGLGLLRYAHTDVEVGDRTIARGDAVILSTTAANRDGAAFEDAEDFDPTRSPNAHLSFGHGAHFCIGASLARTELRAVFATLARRLPDMRLAVDVDDIEVRADALTGGVTSVPITW